PRAHENALIASVFPVRHAPISHRMRDLHPIVRIETPMRLAGCCVERNDAQCRRGGIEHAVNDDRITLHLRSLENVASVKCPGNLQLMDILPIDLTEPRIANIVPAAAIDIPVSITCFGNLALGEGGVDEYRGEHRCVECHLRW